MNFRIASALLLGAVLTLSGCSRTVDGPDAANTKPATATATATAESTTEPTEEAAEELTESPALVEHDKRKDGTYDRGVRATIGGIVSWEVRPDPKLSKPLGLKLGKEADAFLTDHYLREDRWLGSHAIKVGEMDALAEKVDPKLYATIEKSAQFFDRLRKQTGGDPRKRTAKQKKQIPTYGRTVGHFVLNDSLVDGGKGPIRSEITDKVVWVPGSGTAKGLINTWVSVETRRENNTGSGKEFAIWQAWKPVNGEWLIVQSGWSPL